MKFNANVAKKSLARAQSTFVNSVGIRPVINAVIRLKTSNLLILNLVLCNLGNYADTATGSSS
jgi:hypothetical protein